MAGHPQIELPEIDFVDLTVAEVKAMSDAELLGILSGESAHSGIVPLPLQQLITAELLSRTLVNTSRPHWSVVPSFWLLVSATVLALVAAVAAVLALPQMAAHRAQTPDKVLPVAPTPDKPTEVAGERSAP